MRSTDVLVLPWLCFSRSSRYDTWTWSSQIISKLNNSPNSFQETSQALVQRQHLQLDSPSSEHHANLPTEVHVAYDHSVLHALGVLAQMRQSYLARPRCGFRLSHRICSGGMRGSIDVSAIVFILEKCNTHRRKKERRQRWSFARILFDGKCREGELRCLDILPIQ